MQVSLVLALATGLVTTAPGLVLRGGPDGRPEPQVPQVDGNEDTPCTCSFCHEDGHGDGPHAYTHKTGQVNLNMDFPGPNDVPGKTGPWPVVGDAHLRTNSTMMVLLAGHMDPRCAGTIANVFTRSNYPERMRVGIVDQNTPDSGYDCVATYCKVMEKRGFKECPYLDQIETVRVDATKSFGPAWARSAGAMFVREPEEHDFCLQADAHSDFLQGFDELLPKMWAQTGNEYAVLSTYVPQVVDTITRDGKWASGLNYEVPFLCGVGGGFTHRNAQAAAASCLPRPMLQRTWGAGLSFAKCHFEARVPNDPFLKGVFDGEEFSRALRGWTHGYDFYTPSRAMVFHDYYNRRFHTGSWKRGSESHANDRLQLLMHGDDASLASDKPIVNASTDIGYYGLGHVRTVEQFEQFSSIAVRTNGMGDDGESCENLEQKYVAYAQEPGLGKAAPPPPAETQVPTLVSKGSDRASWENKRLDLTLADGAQEFVTTEVLHRPKDRNRLVGFDMMARELGIKPPAHRASFTTVEAVEA